MTPLDLLPGQHEFLLDDHTEHIAMVGGVGSGKSKGGALKAIDLALKNPGEIVMVGSVDAGTARDTIVLATQQTLDELCIPHDFNKSSLRFEVRPRGQKPSTIKTVTYGQALVGFNAAAFVADELDTLPTAKAREAYELMSNRVRVGRINQHCVTTTPEGFRFCYEFFQNEPTLDPRKAAKRRLIRASTLDNPWLPDRYIENIFENRTKEQALAYIYGQFVNFTTGTVYKYFDRAKNKSPFKIEDFPTRPLWCGVDFNVDRMACVVGIIDQGTIHILDEFVSFKDQPTIRDTRVLIQKIKERYPNRHIVVCPDASGENRNSAAYSTNLEQLRSAGFELRVNGSNPPIDDRVNSVNALFETEKGARRLFVDIERCPGLVKCLEQQPFGADGKPDKKVGLDDANDALGYLVWQTFPLQNRMVSQVRLIA